MLRASTRRLLVHFLGEYFNCQYAKCDVFDGALTQSVTVDSPVLRFVRRLVEYSYNGIEHCRKQWITKILQGKLESSKLDRQDEMR